MDHARWEPSGQPVAQGEAHGLGAALDVQLGEDVMDVVAGGGVADAQLFRDGPVGSSRGQGAQDLPLAGGQVRGRGPRGRRAGGRSLTASDNSSRLWDRR